MKKIAEDAIENTKESVKAAKVAGVDADKARAAVEVAKNKFMKKGY